MKRIGMFLLVNLLVLTTILIVTTVLGVNSYITASGIDYYSLFIFAAIIGFSGSIISLMMSKWMAKHMMNVKVLDPNSNLGSRERQLLNTVDNLAKKAGMKTPEVGIYPSAEVNAFATGPSRNNSLVAVSSGLLERMNSDAVEGVLAHEVAHIANGDMVTMTLLQGVVNTFVVFLARIIAYFLSTFVREEARGIVHFISILVFQILLSILASIAVMAYSRHREFAADSGGAELVGKSKMLNALRSLKNSVHMVDNSQEALATFKISGEKKMGLRQLLSTHPDLDERIKRLEH
ncbi:heat shock protein htpx [hydrocarbon metagenome]|uniref:Heat shock protein htpx n=1 Tax=hydrocarbon metagenome TaxID=938273 RepID=A0A0W8E3X0_9ZZZZ